jgi:hypothetical protein
MLNPKDESGWFKLFIQGLDSPLFFPYSDSVEFENPTSFKLDSFVDDSSTRYLYSLTIHHGFLPVGMSTSNRIIKPGYDSYQPVAVARQFGLGQVPPHFHLHQLKECRANLLDSITTHQCCSLFVDLKIPILADFTFSTDGFNLWCGMWKSHAFRRDLGPSLQQIDAKYEVLDGEILLLTISS